MGGVIWLASYPKSGNTWLRAFLCNLLSGSSAPVDINKLSDYTFGEMSPDLYERVSGRPLAEMSDDEIHRARPQVHRQLAQMRPDISLVKTHHAVAVLKGFATITPDVTAGAVYVVRNPLDVAVSYADHFGLSIDEAIAQMNAFHNRMVTTPTAAFQLLCDWSTHVRSWTEEARGLPLHLIRYEDMLERPEQTFRAVAAYLKLPTKRARLKRAIRNAAFDSLRAQEAKTDFRERSPHSRSFFRAGQAGQWQQALTSAQVDAVVRAHGEVMAKHGYLP